MAGDLDKARDFARRAGEPVRSGFSWRRHVLSGLLGGLVTLTLMLSRGHGALVVVLVAGYTALFVVGTTISVAGERRAARDRRAATTTR